ncbi:MAG: hypothetical protein HW380_3698 [Magnetococcales bacterium]|nr:hypothetical protein [Magnetococcales bacterium]
MHPEHRHVGLSAFSPGRGLGVPFAELQPWPLPRRTKARFFVRRNCQGFLDSSTGELLPCPPFSTFVDLGGPFFGFFGLACHPVLCSHCPCLHSQQSSISKLHFKHKGILLPHTSYGGHHPRSVSSANPVSSIYVAPVLTPTDSSFSFNPMFSM